MNGEHELRPKVVGMRLCRVWWAGSFVEFGCACSQCFPGGVMVKNPPVMQETQEIWIPLLGLEDPLE